MAHPGTAPVLLVLWALLAPSPAPAQQATNRDQSGYTSLREEGHPVKEGLEFASAANASLLDGDMVLGVVVAGEARAYPLNVMWEPENEVLNDRLGGIPIAATWCPIAHSAVVYDRTIEGGEIDLGAVGLDRGVFILYDRQTRSWWSQIAGRALRGPLEGAGLRKRETTLTTWGRWRALHPGTTVYVDPGAEVRRRFTEESVSRITLAGPGAVVNEDLVVGVEGLESDRAYLLRGLVPLRVVNDEIDGEPIAVFLAEDAVTARVLGRSVDGRSLTLRAEGDRLRDTETGTLWDPMTGAGIEGPLRERSLEPRVFTQALWYAWRSQRPDTTLWEGESSP